MAADDAAGRRRRFQQPLRRRFQRPLRRRQRERVGDGAILPKSIICNARSISFNAKPDTLSEPSFRMVQAPSWQPPPAPMFLNWCSLPRKISMSSQPSAGRLTSTTCNHHYESTMVKHSDLSNTK